MVKKFGFAALAASVAFIATPAMAQDSGVVGTWNTAVETPGGNFESAWTFAEDGGVYTLEMENAPAEGGPGGDMEATTSDVVVEGNTFSFKQAVTTPQGAMEIAISGTVDGDALTAEANTDFGAMPISGTRAE